MTDNHEHSSQMPSRPKFGMLPQQKAVSPEEAKKARAQQKLPANIFRPEHLEGLQANVPLGTPSISEQARALKNDVDLIFQFVHDNIEFIPNYGLHKGGLGALIDGSGNSFDQSDLMVQLLTTAGYTAKYVFGNINLSADQWSNWLDIDEGDLTLASNLLANGGIGNTPNSGTNYISLEHCWVQVTISGTNYVFDPAFKQYNYTTGIDVGTAMSYSRTTFLSDANSGSTLTTDYVQKINDANITSDLTTYSMNLVSWIKSHMPGAGLDDILGGRSIVAVEGPIRQTSLPYQTGTPDIETAVPSTDKATMQIQYDYNTSTSSYNIDKTFYTADIYSQRMTLWWDGSYVARLYLSGSQVLPTTSTTSSAQSAGTTTNMKITVTHPYPTTFANTSQLSPIRAAAQTAIGSAWGITSKQMAAIHQLAQNQSFADGVTATAESMLGQSLLLIWDNFMAQGSSGIDILSRISDCSTVIHHFVGTVGHMAFGSGKIKLVDTFLGFFNISPLDDTTDTQSVGVTTSLFMQALESAAHQQVTGLLAADPLKVIKTANSLTGSGYTIYDAHSSNWTTGTNVRSIMLAAGYTSTLLDSIKTNYLDNGWRVAMPDNANITIGSLTGVNAYMGIAPAGSNDSTIIGQTLFGSKGSVASDFQDDGTTNSVSSDNARQVNGFGMPAVTSNSSSRVNMLNGRYEYASTDLTVGNQGAPYALSFTRNYNSDLRLVFQGMGFGWCHNWQMKASTNSDGFIGFGDQQVSAAAAAIATLFVTRDVVLSNSSLPINNVVTLCIAQEFLASQLVNNTVRLQFGGNFAIFTKMPDGSYLPPLGMNGASSLTLSSGAYTFTTAEKVVFSYSTAGKLTSIAYPFGITINVTYNSHGDIATVSNGFRQLNFSYDAYFQLASVDDNHSHSVGFSVNNTTGNLDYVNDPLLNKTTYVYASRGLMTQYFEPNNPSQAIITNAYDSLSRVEQQTDAYGNVWNFYLAGSRSEEVAPNSTSRILYFNALGSTLQAINALGQTVTTEYDGVQRPTLVTLPEGNSNSMTYDANGNLLSLTQHAKPGSALADRTTTMTYDSVWTTQVSTVTDPASNVTTTTYAAVGANGAGKITQIQQPAVGGSTPTTTNTYSSKGQLLTTTDPTGRVTQNIYDTSGGSPTYNLLSTVVDPTTTTPPHTGLNITSQFTFDAVGNVLTTTDPNGNVTTAAYDSNRRVTQVTGPSPFSPVSYISYDANGNVIQTQSLASTDANSQITTATYTIDDKVATVTGPANFGQGSQPNPVVYQYDSLRRLSQVNDPVGNIATTVFDNISRPLSSAINGVTQQTLAYTDNGKVLSVTDANSNVTQYQYDGFDRPSLVTYPDSSTESVSSYDVNNNVLAATTRAGLEYDFTFDVLNRLLTKTPSGGTTITFSYDLAGRVLTVSTPTVSGDPSTGAFTLNYDSAGRMYQEQYPDSKTVTATMDSNGNVTGLTYPAGGTNVVTNAFDALNRVASVSGFTGSVAFNYDSASRRLSQQNGNNTGQGYFFDTTDNLMSMTIAGLQPNISLGTPTRLDFSYWINNAAQNVSKRCNSSNFLWEPSSMSTITYGTANNLNQYPSVESVSYSYNSNGCLTGDGTNTYAFDTENRLTSITTPSDTITFKYDPFGRLTLRTTSSSSTRYLYSGMQRIEEYNYSTGSLLTRYVYGVGLDECLFVVNNSTGAVTYLHADETGSPVLTTDSTGTPNNVNVFTPWGHLASGSLATIPIGYTGQFYEPAADLYFYKARHYSPSLGRFLQPDPVGYGGGLNMYEYAGSDPVNSCDPLGLDEFSDGVALFGLAIGGSIGDQLHGLFGGGPSSAAVNVALEVNLTALFTYANNIAGQAANALLGIRPAYAAAPQHKDFYKASVSLNVYTTGNSGTAPPSLPPGESYERNAADAKRHRGDLLWFYNKVRNNKGNIRPDSWDYKQRGDKYQNGGNYNYGWSGAAAGFKLQFLQRAAGGAQILSNTSEPSWGAPWGSFPYGDDPKDQAEIIRGFSNYWLKYGNHR